MVEVPIRHCGFTRDLVLVMKLLSSYAVWLRLHHRLHIRWSCLLSWRCPRVLLHRSLSLVCRFDCRCCLIWLLLHLLRRCYNLAWNRRLGNSIVKSVSSCMSSLINWFGFVFSSTSWCDIAGSVEDDILTGKHLVKLFNLLDLAGVHVLICCWYNWAGDYLLDQLLLLLAIFSNFLDLGAPTALKFFHNHVSIVTQFLSSFTVDTVFVSTDLALNKNVICFSAGLSVSTCSVLVLSVAGPTSRVHNNRPCVSALKCTALLLISTGATPPIGRVSIGSWFVVVLGWVGVMGLCHLRVLVLESLVATLLNLLWILKNGRYHLLLP